TSVFARPAGQAGTVHATVTCVTSLGLGFGSRTVHATGSAPVDTYRERRG
ncbi:ATP/GTP-binding protein, partial [Cutibacterium acnes]